MDTLNNNFFFADGGEQNLQDDKACGVYDANSYSFKPVSEQFLCKHFYPPLSSFIIF